MFVCLILYILKNFTICVLVFQTLNQLNNSIVHFKQCCTLDPSGKMSREMYHAALCERRMEAASVERTHKLDDTQRKLDLFYSNMDLIRKQQASEEGLEEMGGGSEVGVNKNGRRKTRRRKNGLEEIRAVHAVPVLDPNTRNGGMDSEGNGELDLERALDQSLNKTEEDLPKNNESSREGKAKTRLNFRLVLKPLPSGSKEEEEKAGGVAIDDAGSGGSNRCCIDGESGLIPEPNRCPNEAVSSFFHDTLVRGCRPCYVSVPYPHTSRNKRTEFGGKWVWSSTAEIKTDGRENIDNEDSNKNTDEASSSGNGRRYDNEMAVFDHIEQDFHHPQANAPSTSTPSTEYPPKYYSLEFPPYNPLSKKLEGTIFPKTHSPRPLFHDPYWPRKRECLDLVRDLKRNSHLNGYMGTFITPEARGAE